MKKTLLFLSLFACNTLHATWSLGGIDAGDLKVLAKGHPVIGGPGDKFCLMPYDETARGNIETVANHSISGQEIYQGDNLKAMVSQEQEKVLVFGTNTAGIKEIWTKVSRLPAFPDIKPCDALTLVESLYEGREGSREAALASYEIHLISDGITEKNRKKHWAHSMDAEQGYDIAQSFDWFNVEAMTPFINENGHIEQVYGININNDATNNEDKTLATFSLSRAL